MTAPTRSPAEAPASAQPSVRELGERAQAAARVLATLTRADKDAALHAMADALLADRAEVLAANAEDVARAESGDTPAAMIDRLRLDDARLDAMADGLRALAGLADPVGEVVRGWTRPDGVQIRQVRVPLGVVGIIYEARPNVTTDAAGICLKSGNAAILRGSSSAASSNAAIATALRAGLEGSAVPVDAVQLLPGPREVTGELMAARGLVDVLIPRGGASLIETVVTQSVVPVIETGTGNNHLFVDADADVPAAVRILLNTKVQRPSVCNSVETLLVHRGIAASFLPPALAALAEAGVTVHADEAFCRTAENVAPGSGATIVAAQEGDFDAEALSLDLSARLVGSLDEALEHIRTHSTKHSEMIVTDSASTAQRFTAEVDSAAVLVNASSRFVDGGEFGFGAEIGISTQKLHARGPMGLGEMTASKYVVTGSGQTKP